MDRNRITELARECLGTPFVHQGRKLHVGMDCAGVVVHVLEGLGLPFNDMDGYGRTPFDGMLKKSLDGQPSMQRVYHLEPGVVVLMRITTDPQHLVIFTGQKIIHSTSHIGRVVEQGFPPRDQGRICAIYRIVES